MFPGRLSRHTFPYSSPKQSENPWTLYIKQKKKKKKKKEDSEKRKKKGIAVGGL